MSTPLPPDFSVSIELDSRIALCTHYVNPRFDEAGEPATVEIEIPGTLQAAGARRRREFLAGRRCALAALAAMGHGSVQIPIGPDGAPVWPSGFSGSISHCTRWVTAAVSDTAELRPGVDCEALIEHSAYLQISGLVASREEIDAAERILGNPLLALTVIFSAKESAYKSLWPYQREGCDFSHLRVEISGATKGKLQVIDTRRGESRAVLSGRFMLLDSRHVLTLTMLRSLKQGR